MDDTYSQSGLIETHHVVARRPELDILRGIAVVLVLGRHILYIPDSIPSFISTFFLVWREMGWIGVDFFFVLSGFLVSGLLFSEYQRTEKVGIGRFLIRRGFKIYPSFYVFLAVSVLSFWLFNIPASMSREGFIGEALFIQNYYAAVWNHTWSLAVEEHFYILLSLLIFVLTRSRSANPFRVIPLVVGAVGVLLLALRVMISLRYPAGIWWCTLNLTNLRIDSLFFGVLLAYRYHYHGEALAAFVNRFSSLLMVLGIVTVIIPLFFPLTSSRFMYSYGFTILYLGFGGILLLSMLYQFRGRDTVIRLAMPLAIVGRNSYSIYLWHMMIYYFSAKICPPNGGFLAFYTQVTLFIAGSIAVGSLAAKAVEFPVLRIRDRYFS